VAGIGEFNQTDLHEQLKYLYAGNAGQTEVDVDGFIVDVLLPGEIIEIQTRHLGKIRKKIEALRRLHDVRVVYPVAMATSIVKIARDGSVISQRRSPKRGRLESAFREIASIADLLPHRSVTIEVALVNVTEFRRDDGQGSWRRRGVSIVGRKLESIAEVHRFMTGGDYLSILPEGLELEFTNRDLCNSAGWRYATAQPVTSALRKMGLIEISGKSGRETLYRVQ